MRILLILYSLPTLDSFESTQCGFQYASNTPIHSIDVDGLEQGGATTITTKMMGIDIIQKYPQSKQMNAGPVMTQAKALNNLVTYPAVIRKPPLHPVLI